MATVVISAGHNKGTGARAHDSTDEWSWCMISVEACKSKLEKLGHTCHVIHRHKSSGYTSAMRKLAREIKRLKADVCAEFHFNNSSNKSANGYEFLHWWGSSASKRLAASMADCFGSVFPKIKPRGNNGVRSLWFRSWNKTKAYSGRGGAYCFLTPCPAIICEPGFSSNRDDWHALVDNAEAVGKSYAVGIDNYLNKK